jgi:hypothetical protein
VEVDPLLVQPEVLGRGYLELFEGFEDRHDVRSERLERLGDPERKILDAHEPQALLGESRAGAVPHELVSEHAADVPDDERVVGVFQNGAMPRTQEVEEVLLLVSPYPGDVRVEALGPGAVAGPARRFDQQLAVVDALVLLPAHLQPRVAPDRLQVPLEGPQVDGGAGDELDLGRRFLHG